jgi:ATP/maltotriose-dependent transcriptional regulator MalT
MMQRALAVDEKAYRPRHRRVAHALEGVAGVLLELQRCDDERSNAERAPAVREVIAPNDVRVANALSALAEAIHVQGDLQAALRLRERAVEVAEGALDHDHPMVARALLDLSSLQVESGALDNAGQTWARAGSVGHTAGP